MTSKSTASMWQNWVICSQRADWGGREARPNQMLVKLRPEVALAMFLLPMDRRGRDASRASDHWPLLFQSLLRWGLCPFPKSQ